VRQDLREGIVVTSLAEAARVVDNLPRLRGPTDTPEPSPTLTPTAPPTP
jgi:hypothetical protein